jgi:cell division protein FtsB
MELNGILITVIGGLVIAAVLNLRNSAVAQGLINSRFERLEKDGEKLATTADKLRDENATLVAKVASLETANIILMSTQSTERGLAESRAEKYGKLEARVERQDAEITVLKQEVIDGKQRELVLIEKLRLAVDGLPAEIKALKLEIADLRSGTPAQDVPRSPAADGTYLPSALEAQNAVTPSTPLVQHVQQVEIVGQTQPVEVKPAADITPAMDAQSDERKSA